MGVPSIDCLQTGTWNRGRIEQCRKGGLDCAHITLGVWEDFRETVRELTRWRRLIAQNSDIATIATSAKEIEDAKAAGKVAIVFGLQNAAAIEDDIELVSVLWDLGVRIMQLTYNIQNMIGSGCWEPPQAGLSTHFGRHVIKEMNRVGMLIDVSHCNEQTSFDAVRFSERPIAITHSNPLEYVGDKIELPYRNKSTELIKEVIAGGGIIGVSMYPRIVPADKEFTLERFVDLVEWTIDKFGWQNVGIGSDLNLGNEGRTSWFRMGRFAREMAIQPKGGATKWHPWFQSSADYGAVVAGFKKRGFPQEAVDGVMGGNFLRIFREAFVPR